MNGQPKPTKGIVHIDNHEQELLEPEARTLFLLAVTTARRGGGALAISPHVMVMITPNTRVSLTIPDGFAEEYDPGALLNTKLTQRATKRAQAVI
ncbi:hypothetical protein [Leifsonia sp. 1010]|uniref:hypothetical protein n=1 Tax=Leifsonia sp. 1010 TaxID=2817769 RepID=UPI00285F20B4|nr:hypothetical protein [Leifsonia sp. 1010]MDR6613596.1 hypothetical protein [Leifsonia sp. 1010]